MTTAATEAMKGAPDPQMASHVERAIAALAELIARGRTAVNRERDDSVEYEPEAEGATRLAQQFSQLAKGSARLEGRAMVSDSDLTLVRRVAFDTLPPHRAAVLRALLNDEEPKAARLSRTTLGRAVADLALVGLLTKGGQFTKEVRRLFGMAGLLTM